MSRFDFFLKAIILDEKWSTLRSEQKLSDADETRNSRRILQILYKHIPMADNRKEKLETAIAGIKKQIAAPDTSPPLKAVLERALKKAEDEYATLETPAEKKAEGKAEDKKEEKKAEKQTGTHLETILFTRAEAESWEIPPFQRPVTRNQRVLALGDELGRFDETRRRTGDDARRRQGTPGSPAARADRNRDRPDLQGG